MSYAEFLARKITPVEALNRFGVMRLAARVHELRRRAWRRDKGSDSCNR